MSSGLRFHPRLDWAPLLPTHQQVMVERSRYSRLETQFRVRVQSLLKLHKSKQLDDNGLTDTFKRALADFQFKSFILGRRVSGNMNPVLSVEERRWLHGQHAQEMKFFHRMVSQGQNRMPLEQRIDLYALGSFSVYCYSLLGQYPQDTKWHYHLGVAEHCEDCVNKQRLSRKNNGFTLGELLEVGLPSEKCRCGHRCQCWLSSEGVVIRRPRKTGFNSFQARYSKR